MSHFLNDDQKAIRDVAAKFAVNELMPIANEIDASESTPDWVVKRCAELGFYGIYIAEEFGGIGAGLVTACVVLEEIAKAKEADLTAASLDAAVRTIAGSARSMGLVVEG